MRFFWCDDAGDESVVLKNENYKHIVKACRHRVDDTVHLRSTRNPTLLHSYNIVEILGRIAKLSLQESKTLEIKADSNLHIGWCIIDPKSIEKVIPTLCELGVEQITFIKCDRSQSFKLDLERLDRIVLNSMQQCGRTSLMKFETAASIEQFVQKYPQTVVFDFSHTYLNADESIEVVLIGCEGGFSDKERTLLSKSRKLSLNTPMILRSESASLAVATKILL